MGDDHLPRAWRLRVALAAAALAGAACGGIATSSGHDGDASRDASPSPDGTMREDAPEPSETGAETRDGTTEGSSWNADADETLDAKAGDGGATPHDGGFVCNALVARGQPVTARFIATPAPSAAGGAVVPGTYVLSAYDTYTGPGGQSGDTDRRILGTIEITSGSLENAAVNLFTEPDGSTGMIDLLDETGTFTTSGMNFMFVVTCPEMDNVSEQYTATPTSISFATVPKNAGTVVVSTYQRQ